MKRFSVQPKRARFNTSDCSSPNYLQNVQRMYGTFDCQRNAVRGPFWDFTYSYPSAGANQINFFGNGISTSVNRQLTNLARPNSFTPNWFLLHRISLGLYIESQGLPLWAGTDATTLVSELVAGFCSAGFFELKLGGNTIIEEPQPFYRMPPADGQYDLWTAGITSLTLTEGTPNVLATFCTSAPVAHLAAKQAHNGSTNAYLLDPPIMFRPEDPFSAVLSFPTGALAALATGIYDSTATFLRVGIIFDGVIFKTVA